MSEDAPGSEQSGRLQARKLIELIANEEWGPIVQSGDASRVFPVVALVRCAHLLRAMLACPVDTTDPLVLMGSRAAVETAVNGLLTLMWPDKLGPLVREDIDARVKLGRLLNLHEKADELREATRGLLTGEPKPEHFNDRVRALRGALPERISDDWARGARIVYRDLSNSVAHGGVGSLNSYVSETANGLQLVRTPTSTNPTPDQAIIFALGWTRILFDEVCASEARADRR